MELRPRKNLITKETGEQQKHQNFSAFEEQEEHEMAQFFAQTFDFLEDDFQRGNNNHASSSSTSTKKRPRPRWSKKFHRHSDEQIQDLEEFFKECQNPDEMTRRDLSHKLGMKASQIKFWFQNKRTQVKNQLERSENQRLRAENEQLRVGNESLKEALKGITCPNCSADPFFSNSSIKTQLLLQNNELQQEIMRLSAIVAQHNGNTVAPSSSSPALQQVLGGEIISGAAGSYTELITGAACFAEDEAGDNGSAAGYGWPDSSELGFGG